MPGVLKDFLTQHVQIFLRNITYTWMDCWNLLCSFALTGRHDVCNMGMVWNLYEFISSLLAYWSGSYTGCLLNMSITRRGNWKGTSICIKNCGISKVKGDGIMRLQVQAWEWTINIMSNTNKRDSQLDLEDRNWQVNSIQQGGKQKCIDLEASIHVDKGLSEATQSLLCKDTRLGWNWNKLIIRTWAGY